MWLLNLISSTSLQETKSSFETFVQQHRADIEAAIQNGDSAEYVDYVYQEHLGSGIHLALSELDSEKQLSNDVINRLLQDVISAKHYFKRENKTLEVKACHLLAYELAYRKIEMQNVNQELPETIDETKKLIKTIKEQVTQDEERKKNLAILLPLQDILGKAVTRVVDRINVLSEGLKGPFSTSNEINLLAKLLDDKKPHLIKRNKDQQTDILSCSSVLKKINQLIHAMEVSDKICSTSHIQEIQNDFNKLIEKLETEKAEKERFEKEKQESLKPTAKQNGYIDFLATLITILKSYDQQEITPEENSTEIIVKNASTTQESVKPSTSSKGRWGSFMNIFKVNNGTAPHQSSAAAHVSSKNNKIG